MIRLIFLSVLLITLCFIQSVVAQKLVIIELNQTDRYFVNDLRSVLSPGDSLMFRTTDGDFAIYIEGAAKFLEIEEPDLKVLVNDSNPESEIYIARDFDSIIDQSYSIYCITNNSWPEAPPRIIIVAQ